MIASDSLNALVQIVLLNFPPFAHSASTVSIVSDAGYVAERVCAQDCVWHVGVNDDLITFLGCSNVDGWLNSCYCRSDLQVSASSFLTSCVNKACSTNPVDLAGAVEVYSTYCTDAVGAFTQASGVEATTTLGGDSSTQTVLVITTVISASGADSSVLDSIFTTSTLPSTTVPPPSTLSPSKTTTIHSTVTLAPTGTGNANAGGGLSISDRIALGIGLGLGIPTLLVGIAACLRTFNVVGY